MDRKKMNTSVSSNLAALRSETVTLYTVDCEVDAPISLAGNTAGWVDRTVGLVCVIMAGWTGVTAEQTALSIAGSAEVITVLVAVSMVGWEHEDGAALPAICHEAIIDDGNGLH